MIGTKIKIRKQIDDLQKELEIINPLESKTILGGEWYDGYPTYNGGMLGGVTVGGSSGGGGGGYWYDSSGGSYSSDWNNIDGNNGNGGGGGGGAGYDGVPNLPSTVEQQLGSMGACVSYAMSFVSGVLGHQLNGATMALHNAQTLNTSVQNTISTGLTISEASQAIQSYFFTTALTNTTQVINALEVGQHPVLANVVVYDNQHNVIQGLGHEVALVDYDPSTGLFTAADSNTGTYINYTANDINLNAGVYQINGVKP